MLLLLLFVATVFLAYSNGANDNFKGMATLYGSGTLNFKSALSIATIATFAGSLCSLLIADGLVSAFSGKGLVTQEIAGTSDFLLAVALGAGATVFLATLIGFPISTTHSLIGALVGAGLMASDSGINLSVLGNKFFLPLLASPLIALSMGAAVYLAGRWLRLRLKLNKEQCICIGEVETITPLASPGSVFNMNMSRTSIEINVADGDSCVERYSGNFLNIPVQKALDLGHILSGASVCFARGLNDTPKIVALMLGVTALNINYGLFIIGVAMAVGGLLQAHKVAHTISQKITPLNHGQGFAANIVTAFLVIFASRMGVPVSTTHVSVGAIFGIGCITGQGDKAMIGKIVLSWLITLPAALSLGAICYWLI